MDWPVFILITYAFALALLLVFIIMRSVSSSRSRYQRLLEEKEQKLAAMQLDVEETLEVLGDQAAALELALGEAEKRERAANQALQQRLLEVQGAVVSAQSRLLRLEQGMEELRKPLLTAIPAQPGIGAGEPAALIGPEPGEAEPENPEAQEPEAEAAKEEPAQAAQEPEPGAEAQETAEEKPKARGRKRASRKPKPAGGAEEAEAEPAEEAVVEPEELDAPPQAADAGIRERAVALFEMGESVARVSRIVGCSSVEAAMLHNQWKRGYFSQDVPGR